MNDIYSILTRIKKQNKTKIEGKFYTTLLKSILAGMFIGLGGTVAIRVANKFSEQDGMGSIMSYFTFTIGFVLIITLGVELFTSSNLITLNVLDKDTHIRKVLKNWSIVWVGNWIGTGLIAAMIYFADAFKDVEIAYLVSLAEKKIHLSFISALLLGIGCNMIIVLTVMLVNATNEYLGKVVVAVFGVMIFLLSGYEHAIANMFYLSLASMFDTSITLWHSFIHNILPVTIGNLFGGAIIIPLFFHLTYKKRTN